MSLRSGDLPSPRRASATACGSKVTALTRLADGARHGGPSAAVLEADYFARGRRGFLAGAIKGAVRERSGLLVWQSVFLFACPVVGRCIFFPAALLGASVRLDKLAPLASAPKYSILRARACEVLCDWLGRERDCGRALEASISYLISDCGRVLDSRDRSSRLQKLLVAARGQQNQAGREGYARCVGSGVACQGFPTGFERGVLQGPCRSS